MAALWLFFTLFAAPSLKAQLYLGAHLGLSLPQADYADSRMSDNQWMFSEGHQQWAGAGRGWGGGLSVDYALPFHPNLEIAFEADYLRGGVNRDVREYYQFSFQNRYSQCSHYQMVLPKFQHISLRLGMRYCYPLGGIFDFYGEALAGVNFRLVSDWALLYTRNEWVPVEGIEYPEYDNVDIRKYDPAATFAFSVGTGVLIKKSVSVGASLMMLGSSPLSWDRYTATRYNVYGNIAAYEETRHVHYTDIAPMLVMVKVAYRLQPFNTRHVQDW